MSLYRFTPEAESDLFEIWCRIAHDSVRAANKVEASILRACALLAESPGIGATRHDLTLLPLRFWTVPAYRNYLVVYDPQARPIHIIRVLHGARNIAALLGGK